MPKERPILFSAAMIQALLAGRKTQTRRIVKGAPHDAGCAVYSQPWQTPGQSSALFFAGPTPESRGLARVKCPYGVPGDRLWVRETFYCNRFDYPDGPRDELKAELYYAADGLPNFEGEEAEIRWRPSIHMPRWASRLTLEITGVRLERLHDISDADAWAEGVQAPAGSVTRYQGEGRGLFFDLWRTINGEASLDANPYVWVVEFKVVTA